jgi:hypothetical protein
VPEFNCFFVFSERRKKRSSRVGSKAGRYKPVIYGFPGLRVHRHLVNLPALFLKPQPALTFSLIVAFYFE